MSFQGIVFLWRMSRQAVTRSVAMMRNGQKIFGKPRNLSTSSQLQVYKYETLSVKTVSPFVTHVELNRPDNLNAMNKEFWKDIRDCFQKLSDDEDCRSVVLSGSGRMFTAGLDFSDLGDVINLHQSEEDVARKGKKYYNLLRGYQDSFTALEKCNKPVIAAIHNACIGGGVDMICAADIRYASKDAWFQIKEVDIGLAADVGTLQRLPKIVGNESLVRELTYSARKLDSDEALSFGLISKVFPDKDSLLKGALQLATEIAEKSPVAVQGSKINLNYSRDHTVDESLEFMGRWNMAHLQSEDLMKAAMAMMQKQKAQFSKL